MACLAACLGFMWIPIYGTLEDFAQRGAREALTIAVNWIIQKTGGTDSRELLGNFPHSVVGAEEPLSKIRWLLEDDDSKIIGIYGMGGVGKTTLLKTINDEYLQTRSDLFDIVIFVTVSKVILVDSIQKEIGEKLKFEDNFGRDTADRSKKLFNELRKKFLLLLDDLWEKLDLAVVGIPHVDYSKKGSKVVFTTRSIRVCSVMDASDSKVEVPSLSPEKSWELFCKSLGKRDDQWTDSTRTLAKAVAEKCGGLPLALITVGRAMANATWNWEWRRALESIGELEEVKEEVLPSLKFSFDRLREEKHKECLLYCSLFPEDHNIEVEELIEYWIGEDLLESDKCSLEKARECGLAAINDLKSVCLLEDNSNGGHSQVKLHDMVREMVLWITSCKCRTEKTRFSVNSGEKLESAPISEIWADATKVSLMYNDIKELPERPECRNLRTLLLKMNKPLRYIPCEFFQSMPLLTVFDVSYTRLELLPPEIGLLLNLRFLNLSGTPIKSLPLEVGKLKKLTILKLCRTDRLEKIPKQAILSLSSIRLLNIDNTGYEWRGGWKGDCGETGLCFRDLDSLKQLEELDLTIVIKVQEDLCGLLSSRKLWSVVRVLNLEGLSTSCIDWSGDFEDPKGLRRLRIRDCFKLEQMIFPTNKFRKLEILNLVRLSLKMISWSNVKCGSCFENLRKLFIKGCESLEHITWVKDLPLLQALDLKECTKMEEIIKAEEADVNGMVDKKDSYFPRLRHIHLRNMPNLKTICRQVLHLPCLEDVFVRRCPNLKKLPFGFDSAEKVERIFGETLWWNGLEWDNLHIRSKFNEDGGPVFIAHDF